jgi:glycosyltransferase involved in cell wall biosynthesis
MTKPAYGSGSYMHYLVRSLLRTCPDDIELYFVFSGAKLPALIPTARVVQLSRVPVLRDRQLAGFDIVLLNGIDLRSPVFFHRTPVITVIHGGWEIVQRKPFRKYLKKRWLRPLLLFRSTINVTVSESSRRLLEAAWPTPPFDVILAGVDHGRFRPTPLTEPFEVGGVRIEPGRYLFHLSHCVARKNPADMVQLFRRYAERHPSSRLRLVIAGKGWKAAVEALARTTGMRTDDTDCLGFVREEDLPKLYSNALAFLFFSVYEGFGLPVVEAMACGCPVLVNRAFSLEEVAPEDSLFDLRNSDEHERLLTRIEELASRPEERARMSTLSLAAARRFSWDDAAARFFALFRSCAARRCH